jgi:hypothetical protein
VYNLACPNFNTQISAYICEGLQNKIKLIELICTSKEIKLFFSSGFFNDYAATTSALCLS